MVRRMELSLSAKEKRPEGREEKEKKGREGSGTR
jgi:hypothetical protein